MKWATQLVTWASTVVVARILTPEDYGLLAMSTVFLGLITMLSEFGFGSAIVVLRDLTDDQVAQLNTAALAFGLIGFGVGCAAAWPLSAFFDAPALVPITIVMSAGFIITAFQVVPQALLQRDLRFKPLALIQGTQALVASVAAVVFAMAGLRYWTLVLGSLLSLLVHAGAIVALRPQAYGVPRLREIAPALRFSWRILAQRLAWYAYNRADIMIAGRMLGSRALGAYSIAWSLANIPIEKVTVVVTRVTPAYFAAVQHDPAALRRYLLRITEALGLLVVPATVGLALVTPDLVPLVFGDKWTAVIAPLQLLAMYASVRSVVTLLPQVLNVVGESRFVMLNNVLALCVLPPAFYLGTRAGTMGVAAAWALVYPLVTIPLYAKVFRLLGLSPLTYARALWPALSGCLLMTVAVLAVRALLPADLPLAVRVAAQVGMGGIVYAATTLHLHRERVLAFVRLLKEARNERE